MRLGRYSHRAQPVIAADLDDQSGDGRVQMNVLVRVDMVEHEAGGAERLELRADLGGKPAARAGTEEKAQPGAQRVVVEPAIAANEPVQLVRRQYRAAVDQHQMQPDI